MYPILQYSTSLERDEKYQKPAKDNMPALSYVSLIALMAMATPAVTIVLSQLAPPSGPGPLDGWAALGAFLASAIMAIAEGKPGTGTNWRSRVITIIISCSFFGCFGPGFTVYSLAPNLPFGWGDGAGKFGHSLTWQGWAIAGFILGIFGWAIVILLMKIANMLPVWGAKEAQRRLDVLSRTRPYRPDYIIDEERDE